MALDQQKYSVRLEPIVFRRPPPDKSTSVSEMIHLAAPPIRGNPMRAVIQKVSHAQVDVLSEGHRETSGKISHGFLILLGITHADNETDASYIADKIANLRIFEDEAGKLNLSLKDTGGSVLLVSQFTLYADARSGRRPSFSAAAPARQAESLYQRTAELLRAHGLTVETGRFQTHMQVSLCNDGPVTLLLDSKKLF